MAVLGSFRQTPAEVKRYVLDYSEWLNCDTNETLATDTYVVTPTGTIPLVATGAISSSFKSLVVFIHGGDNGTKYKIIVTVTTSEGQTKQDEFFITVVAI